MLCDNLSPKNMDYKQNEIAIKAIKDRVIHGTGIQFGTPETKDWDGEFFIKETETGLINGANRPYVMEHGFSRNFGMVKVGDTIYELSEDGWKYETVFLDSPIGNKAYQEVITHPYKSSAGAAGHTRRATVVKGALQIDVWLVAEQSATLTPSDSSNPRITRTKSDFLLFAVREMLEDMQTENEKKVKTIVEAIEKSGNEARQKLADALTNLKNSFTSTGGKDFILTDDILDAFEQASKPIDIISLV